MTINPLRCKPIRSGVVLILPFVLAGCFFNLGEHEGFASWYYGDPGMAGALGEAQCDRYADRIQGDRHRYYLHFRTPEVLLQPQGGAHYPARLTAEGRQGGSEPDVQTCEQASKGWETFQFDTVDAGLVDTVIPYRKDRVVNERERGFGQASWAYAEGLTYNTGVTVVMKAPVYIVHDILKTLYIPVAGTYYLLKPDAQPEAPAESIPVQETTLTQTTTSAAAAPVLYAANASVLFVDATESLADTAEEDVASPSGSPPMVGADDDTAAPAPEHPEKTAVDPPASAGYGERPSPGDRAADAAGAYKVTEKEPSAEASDNAAASTEAVQAEKDKPTWPPTDEVLGIPIPPASARPTGVAPEPAAVAAPEDDVAGRVPADETQENPHDVSAVEGQTLVESPTGDPDAASPPPDKVDARVPDEAEAPASVVEQSDKVAAAAAALSAVARMGTGPEPVASQRERADAPSTGTGPGESVAPPPGGAFAEIAEEDFRAAEVATDGRSEAEAQDAATEHPEEPAPSAPEDASLPVASVTPAQQAVDSQAPPMSEPLEGVRIDKSKLNKKAAFIGFFSRSTGVDESTKAYLQGHLWPVFKARCDDDLTLLRRGDDAYPAALDSLVRDQFGRLNSFELTTVARFSGLNAIIAATIIDIRVASKLSGILWYKTPEGQLRLTILLEVFDAETGTKLLDRTYIREEEVEALEPASGEALRPEDRPVLEAVLRRVAEDLGEDVCETLDDLPWRAYVSGINGERVTLSAGEDAGLVRGNILEVYNSQIIDGLNNQQFFLTGEKVGRIQVIEVFPNRSAALLIEGQGLRDYSVAIP